MWQVLETVENVAEKSVEVRIDETAVVQFAKDLVEEEHRVPAWSGSYHLAGFSKEVVAYLLVLDTINFCFWPAPGSRRWEVAYHGQWLSGYWALAASLKRAVEAGIRITDAEYLGRLSLRELEMILAGNGMLQLMAERLAHLNELGRVLVRDYGGEASALVEAAEGSAIKLVRLLAAKLASFRDVASYGGKRVFFYKRGQLLASDLHAAFRGKSWGEFSDMADLTAFADYKLPQVLRHLGVLCYSDLLGQKVDGGTMLVPGTPEEVEIRANTVWAVELIRRQMKRLGKEIMNFEIDSVLWNLGQRPEYTTKPYHRTVTIFY